MSHVLILDDSELVVQMVQMVCESLGHRVVVATSFAQAVECVSRETFDAIVSDVNVPDLATDPVTGFRNAGCAVPVVLISGQPQASLEAIAQQVGARGAVSKDLGIMGLMEKLPAWLG